MTALICTGSTMHSTIVWKDVFTKVSLSNKAKYFHEIAQVNYLPCEQILCRLLTCREIRLAKEDTERGEKKIVQLFSHQRLRPQL